ncbi:hypothetical protein [Nocardia sp. NPDC019395]|uniref:hypothetical protein n=1 Tax=Nocardia sp. NPDC019395 TaxID=3154686 RepID=UPI00340795C6
MAPEPANPWSGLSSQAEGGALELQPGVVEGLADKCNEVLGRVLAVRGKVELVDSLAPFSTLGSGAALTERFNQKGRELREILDDHEKILNDMMDTFIAAGKAYSATDDDSALDIDRVDKPGTLSDRPNPRLNDTTRVPDYVYPGLRENGGGLPGSLHEPTEGVEFESPQVHPENPHNISYEAYKEMQRALGNEGGQMMPVTVAQAAADWRWLAGQLDEKFDDLVNKMVSVQNSWRSPGVEGGADAARAAVDAYGKDTDKLVANMNLIGDNLEYASQWLSATWYEMGQWDAPPLDDGEQTSDASYVQKQKEAERDAAIRAMDEAYVPGLKNTDGKIAILPEPVPPTTDDPGQNGGNNGGGNNGGGNNGGGNNGGGGTPPGASQQQAALKQIDQQRAELLAAQRDLEEQAQQQEAALQQQQQSLQQQQGAQPLLQAAQQGLQSLGQMGQQLSTAAQQALQQAGITGLPGMPGLQDAVKNYQSALQKAGKLPAGLGGGAGPAGSSGAPGGMPKGAPAPNVEKAAKLFPRAALATTASGQTAGMVSASANPAGAPMGGMPMGGGAGGGAQGGQQKDHKRADYLDSTEWLEEGIGDPAVVAKPVVDQ